MKKNTYKLKKYSKKNVFKGNFSELVDLFCLATPKYCALFKSLKGNRLKFIKNITSKPGTELENFITLEIKKKIIGLCSVYSSSEIQKRQLKTNFIMRNCINRKKRNIFLKKIKKNINSLPSVKKERLYLSRLSILQKYQSMGFGKLILNRILSFHRQFKFISLHVELKNRKAINFYVNNDFKKISKKNNYILYEKKLTS